MALRQSVEELAQVVVGQDNVPEELVDNMMRLSRQATNDHNVHATAIHQRLRYRIMNKSSQKDDGPARVAEFEQNCEVLRKQKFPLLTACMAMFEPLAGSQTQPTSIFMANPVPENSLSTKEVDQSEHIHGDDKFKTHKLLRYSDGKSVTAQTLGTQQRSLVWLSPEAEVLILRDLLFIFQGIEGTHVRFDARTESYVVDPGLAMSTAARDMVLCLCELGWLFARVQTYMRSIKIESGLFAQSFACAVDKELEDYYRLLAVLEQELSRKVEIGNGSSNSSSSRSSSGSSGVGGYGSSSSSRSSRADPSEELHSAAEVAAADSSGLTLIRLRAWMQEPIERMYLMAKLVDGVGPLAGGALLSRLHGHSRHGDPMIATFVQRLLHGTSAPLHTMLHKWVVHGELNDPYREFFVGFNVGVPESAMWQDTYFLRTRMLPSFLSAPLAHKVLSIGRTINFMRECVRQAVAARRRDKNDTESILSFASPQKSSPNAARFTTPSKRSDGDTGQETGQAHNKSNNKSLISPVSKRFSEELEAVTIFRQPGEDAELTEALESLFYQGELKLWEVVSKIAAKVDRRLLSVMKKQFYLQTHLLAFKKFMLLGQGDFITCLMDSVGPELKKRANQLYRHNLNGMLEGALRSSNAQFEPSFVLDRVGVRLLEARPGDSGWEIFALDYAVGAPLTSVFHQKTQTKYRVAFYMLWRLQRAKWTLSTAWKQMVCFNHALGISGSGGGKSGSRDRSRDRVQALPALAPVMHKCTLQRARMTHIVNNISEYLMFEVVETAWNTLTQKLDRANSLDEVVQAHDAYLEEITERALLSSSHEKLNLQLQQMLQSILRFCSLEETLISDALSSVARRRALAEDGFSEAMSVDGTDGPGDAAAAGTTDGVPNYIIQRLNDSAKDYNVQFESLMGMLRAQGEEAEEFLRFLTFRLDFNGYYEAAGKAAAMYSPPNGPN
jgi:gamma-tubulin complex component 3